MTITRGSSGGCLNILRNNSTHRDIQYEDPGVPFGSFHCQVLLYTNTKDSVCYASFGVRADQSTPFAAERNVRKSSIVSFPLTGNHRCLSRQWCDERQTWTTAWNDAIFTDESCFCLQHHDGRIPV
ncbi:uncharacterized protein TNCV_4573051 [Trichonephila clavipes]|nr:uncharacterized protein TNCV_4573051 [Trichonephila clavipes]